MSIYKEIDVWIERWLIDNGKNQWKSNRLNLVPRLGWLVQVFDVQNFSTDRHEIRSADIQSEFAEGDMSTELWDILTNQVYAGGIRYGENQPTEYHTSIFELKYEQFNYLLNFLEIDHEFCSDVYKFVKIKQFSDDENWKRQFEENDYGNGTGRNKFSSRVYHPVQRLPRAIRSEVLADVGYVCQIDIKSCFPTLLLQEWDRVRADDDYWPVDSMWSLPALRELVRDPDGTRHALAADLGLPAGIVKRVVSALVFGAPMPAVDLTLLATWRRIGKVPAVLQMVDHDLAVYARIRKNRFIKDLRVAVKLIRKFLKFPLKQKFINETKQVPNWLNTNDKNWYYWLSEYLERIVRDCLMDVFKRKQIRVFPLHDAVVINKQISPSEINFYSDYVRNRTGYTVRFSVDKLERITDWHKDVDEWVKLKMKSSRKKPVWKRKRDGSHQ